MSALVRRMVDDLLESDDLDLVDASILDRYRDTFDAEDAEKVKSMIQGLDGVYMSNVEVFNGESLVGLYATFIAADIDPKLIFSIFPLVRQHFSAKYGLPFHELDVDFESKPFWQYVLKIGSTRKAIQRHRPQ